MIISHFACFENKKKHIWETFENGFEIIYLQLFSLGNSGGKYLERIKNTSKTRIEED